MALNRQIIVRKIPITKEVNDLSQKGERDQNVLSQTASPLSVELVLNNKLCHTVVDDGLPVLSAVDEAAGAGFIDEAGYAAGELKDIVDSSVGENVLITTGKIEMGFYILSGLKPVHVADPALDINPLADGGIGLEFKLLPKFDLSSQDKGHWALGVHLEIEQETDFLKHIPVQEVRLVDDHYRQQTMNTFHDLKFLMQLALGLASDVFSLKTELFQDTFVKRQRCHFRI